MVGVQPNPRAIRPSPCMTRFVLLFAGLAPTFWGSHPPACHLVGHADAVFLGTVVPPPPGPIRFREHRLRIEQAYKGIGAGTHEVDIRMFFRQPCLDSFDVGRQFLIFARTSSQGPSLLAGLCLPIGPATATSIDFLEQYRAGRTATRIFGSVYHNPRPAALQDPRGLPASGVRIILHSNSAQWDTISGLDGAYSFAGIPPGRYSLKVDVPHSVRVIHHGEFELVAGGCAQQTLGLFHSMVLSGVAVDQRGAPVPQTPIELIPQTPLGQWMDAAAVHAVTDHSGRFQFAGLAPTEYLLGAGIVQDRPEIHSPRPTTYYPGVRERTAAHTIHILPNQSHQDITLPLPNPDPPRLLRIELLWPGGPPTTPHTIKVFLNGQSVQSTIVSPAVHDLPIYSHRPYTVSATAWPGITIPGIRVYAGNQYSRSSPVEIAPGANPITVQLTLKPNAPSQ